jgi:hypothetical protein
LNTKYAHLGLPAGPYCPLKPRLTSTTLYTEITDLGVLIVSREKLDQINIFKVKRIK